ncbi:MAG: glutaredoxin family protein [Chloroflexi bacterium]|nr:MAG: glutaredoxin family protein [Chloroflexota bacterium]
MPHEVVLYVAEGCGLCADASRALAALRSAHPFTLTEVDIHTDPELERRYLIEIPVVVVDGLEVARGAIDFLAVRAALGV